MREESYFHKEEYKGMTIKLVQDEYPESPREWCNVGTMVCWHRRYDLGDKTYHNSDMSVEDYMRAEMLDDATMVEIEKLEDDMSDGYEDKVRKLITDHVDENCVVLKLGLLDHSGLHMYAGGGPHWTDSAGWDSGTVGIIWCSMETARNEWKGSDEEIRKKAREYMEGEVKTYDAFLRGQVATCVVEDENGDMVDCCGGYYPEGNRYAYAISQAKETIDGHLKEQAELALDMTRNI